jgi:sugar O-acyltransferase (sialic acid O-acetyltransferase NeuD family)
MKNIILIGAGGHANSVYDVIISTKKFKLEKILDNKITSRDSFYGHKIFKMDSFLKENYKKKNIHLSFGSIYDLNKRYNIIKKLEKKNIYNFPIIISPNSYVAKNVKIFDGSIIMHNSIINSGSKIYKNVVINTKALIEHDVIIGDNSHVSTGAIVNGGVIIGKNCFIGSGSIIRENISIPDNTFIKMGSLIKK